MVIGAHCTNLKRLEVRDTSVTAEGIRSFLILPDTMKAMNRLVLCDDVWGEFLNDSSADPKWVSVKHKVLTNACSAVDIEMGGLLPVCCRVFWFIGNQFVWRITLMHGTNEMNSFGSLDHCNNLSCDKQPHNATMLN